MDTKTQITIFQLQSEYLLELLTKIRTSLAHLEQMAEEQFRELSASWESESKQVAETQWLLGEETHAFCQRLQAFVDKGQPRYRYERPR